MNIDEVIKDLKFGTLSKRKEAGNLLLSFSGSDLQKFIQPLIVQLDKEKDPEIRKDILVAIGMSGTVESGNILLDFLGRAEESFDAKLTALKSLGNVSSPEVAEKLKDILSSLVDRRVNLRKDAQDKIESANHEIENIDANRISLQTELDALQQEISNDENKINQAGGAMRTRFAVPPTEDSAKTVLSPDEVKKIQEEIKSDRKKAEDKKSKIQELDDKKKVLQDDISKNQDFLAKKFGEVTVTQSYAGGAPMPFGAGPGIQMRGQSNAQAAPEDVQEQTFALTIIQTLGKIGKPDYVSVMEKAWIEYGNKNFELNYGLARAQLGTYDYIGKLADHLKDDYPQNPSSDEIQLRSGNRSCHE